MSTASTKHDFKGIGKASALLVMTAMAANPATLALSQGFLGQIINWGLTMLFSRLASLGLVVLNIGVVSVETLAEAKEFDGSFDEAFAIINKKGKGLTDDEIKAIDNKVISTFRKFATFGRVRRS